MRRVIVSSSQPRRFVKLDSEHSQSDGRSVNRGPSQRSRFLMLTKSSVAPEYENAIGTGIKLECVELGSFHFCWAFIFCQPMKKFQFCAVSGDTRQRHFKWSSTRNDNGGRRIGRNVCSPR